MPPPLTEQIIQLEAAIAALDQQRSTLGDPVVDTSQAALRAQLEALRLQASAGGHDAASLGAQLDRLCQSDLIRLQAPLPERTYLFKHALTQQAAYASLLHKERLTIHRLVAQCYERLFAGRADDIAPILAFHYAESGDDLKTVEYATTAAEQATRRFAVVEASLQCQRALQALTHLADTQEHRRRRVDLMLQYVELAWGATVPEAQLALLAEAEALAAGDALRLARVHTMMAAMHLARSEYREVVRYTRQVLDQAEALRQPAIVATPSAQLGAALVLQGHFADAEPYLVQAARLTDETPGPWQWSWSVSLRAISLAMRGQVGAGLGEIQRGLARMDAMANPVGMVQCRAYVLPVYVESGDIEKLLATSRQTAELASGSGHPLFVAIGLGYAALALSRLGQHEGARLRLAESEAAAARVGGQFLMCDWLAAFHAEIAFNAGALEDALTGAEAAAAFARSRDGLFAEAWSQRVWGQALAALAPHEWREAENHMRESARLFAESDAAPELARTHVAWGLLCRARESVASAREHLEHALRIFERTDIDAESAEVSALVKLI